MTAPTRVQDAARHRLQPLKGLDTGTLAVSEIYLSIQGESTWVGRPCVFVRLTGCHLRCRWCDSRHAFAGGVRRPLGDVVKQALAFDCDLVEITGGEPLLQQAVYPLMTRLAEAGRTVLLETSGTVDIGRVDPRVKRIIDVKCPGSGESEQNRYGNFELLRPGDEVKFVIASRQDYVWACEVVQRHRLPARTTVLFGTAYGQLQPDQLVSWILEDALPVRFGLQTHKAIWGPAKRGV